MTGGTKNLPGFLGEVAHICGIRIALKLAAEYRGSHLKIPKSVTPDSPLSQTVGLEAAEALAAEFGPGNFYVAVGQQGNRAWIRAEIVKLLTEGKSAALIARQLGISERTVDRQRARCRERGGSLPLFDRNQQTEEGPTKVGAYGLNQNQ